MPQSEREQFIQNWEREFQTTMKVLKSFPTNKAEMKPHGKTPTARELAWRMTTEEKIFVNGAITGNYDFSSAMSPAGVPSSLQEIISTYERNHKDHVEKIKKMSDADFNKMVKFMVAPKTMGDVRSGDTLWMMMMDTIHHRGQFSVYLRMADGRVPSIYGPSGDEPWM